MSEERKIPEHIAIILDGNRRWARQRGLPTLQGHTEGANNLEKIAGYCNKIGVKYLTVYAFSTENWKRSEEEVGYLMKLFEKYLSDFETKFKDSSVRIRLAGGIERLPAKLQEGVKRVEEKTKDNKGLTLNLCINYGGRDEIVNATKILAEQVKNGELAIEDITEDLFAKHLRTKDAPDPDLMIRAGGEQRLSGFLLWQTSYSELYFPEVLWPDFDEEELEKAIDEFNNRKRRFGK
ncbi:MAG: isoprenyl transferase [Clostridia bacterium]|nr:isoprenyl transferase [Clostridia bacterium]